MSDVRSVVVAGSRFGQFYAAGVAADPRFVLRGILGQGSRRSRALAERLGVETWCEVEALPDDVRLACVAVGGAARGEQGPALAEALMARGIDVLIEHPLLPREWQDLLRSAERLGRRCLLNTFYPQLPAVARFIELGRQLHRRRGIRHLDAACGVQVGFATLDILAALLEGVGPWSLESPSNDLSAMRGLSLVLAEVPLSLLVLNELAAADDGRMTLLQRVSLTTDRGTLSLLSPHGPLLWTPAVAVPAEDDDGLFALFDEIAGEPLPSAQLWYAEPCNWAQVHQLLWPAAAAEALARGQAQPALLALVLLAVLAWLGCQALAAHLAHRVDADLCNDLRLRLLAHLQRLPLDWFGRQGPDGVARLVEQDVRALHQLIAHAPNDLSNLLVVPLVALLWLAWLHPWLLLFCLLPLVLAAAGFLLLRSARYRDLVLRRNAALERLSADYGEFAHNLLLARQYPGAGIQQGAEASAAAFGEAFGAWVKRVGHLAALVYVQLSTPWLLAWVLLGALALDALGVPLALGQACAFLLLLRALAAPVQALGHGGDALLGARAAAERLQQVFDHAPLAEGRSTREPVDGAVALHGLGHAYEGVEVLADIDLELEDGSLVALVGPSGSGKSTLLHLLARYMDAQRGELEVGGLALKDMPDAVRHRHIALVGQQAAALEISLADNIALFRPDADLQEIRQAARDACLDERIMALPRGYDSVPGRDLQLSGGELQRLALARALLSPARLLLLDEPTSALDPQTARQVLRNLRERGGGRTRVIVAHRLAEVSNADLILVLVAGRLVERGEHAALLAADGAYARLWREQNGAEVAA
ncbi:ATP-binding cassette domain-containing protein [Pseudomonas aeruginosa]|nr:ATP-binding cassette domain-containing protein [Pseudomonas aeruginosa]KWX28890.1 hypothetical protein AW883_21900 [Pseudomonas aeruginosa]KWX29719.1 hypothetical protein AW882_21840 [Pseudomonas aeruginosa]KWX48003.1 hypothetical protein AW884_20775 [Pseudomonas aeruginosa]PTZ82613.1 hypothetical protein DB393_27035 [Pseudomonas aeruginosa]